MSHDRHDHQHDGPGKERRLGIVAALTGAFMVAEAVGGVLSGSLALLADAGHMLTDFASLVLAWLAARVARRPADWKRTYGFDRFSVLAAFVNGLALFAIALWITVEAIGRLVEPAPIAGAAMLAIAALGLAVNIAAFTVLHGGDHAHDLNLRGAALHVLGDLLGSVAAIAAAIVILATGWTPIDPLLSILVVVLIAVAGWRVVRDAGRILLEAAPAGQDARAIASDLAELVGVERVHHVHLWSISESRPMITLQARLGAGADPAAARRAMRDRLETHHGIGHATIEIEHEGPATSAGQERSAMTFRTIDDLDLDGKRVLVRVDINVPMRDGRVTDTTRMEAIRPTIRDIVAKGARPILLAHFGRPKGEIVPELSLEPLATPLSDVLGLPVEFVPECVGEAAEEAAEQLEPGRVLLLENTRFHPGEEENDPEFADALARLGDVYVNDAFSAAHRAHASTEGVAHGLPSAAGRLMQAELGALEKALTNPQRPVVAVVGGAKVSTKLELLGNLILKVDQLVIGGGMANTFLAAHGIEIGRSLAERDMADKAREIESKAKARGCRIILPTDVVVASELREGVEARTVPADECPPDAMILDVGPDTVAEICTRFERAKTVVWNGPLGAFETPPFDAGTVACARKAAELTEAGRLLTVAGGGDTVAALHRAGVADRFSYVSTAGGAFLEWLEGKDLPGVAALGGGRAA